MILKVLKLFLKVQELILAGFLKYNAVNLGGSFGHLEILGVQGFNQFSLDYFMFPFAKDLD